LYHNGYITDPLLLKPVHPRACRNITYLIVLTPEPS